MVHLFCEETIMFVVEDFTKEKKMFKYKNVSNNFMHLVKEAVVDFFMDKPMFDKENFSFYFYDNYVTGLNVCDNHFINLYVEINQPRNVKTAGTVINKKPKKIKDNKVPDMHLPLKDIKDGLYEALINRLGENSMLWKEPFCIRISTVEYYNGERINLWLKVTPCFKYVNDRGVEGVIYYPKNMSDIRIEYPKLSLKNIEKKNIETSGLYKKYVLMFKNIYLAEYASHKKNKNYWTYDTLPFEIFESILYNVPNEIFTGLDKQSILFVVNYIRNKSLKDFVSIDEQESLLFNKYKPMLFSYAKHALDVISNYLKFHI